MRLADESRKLREQVKTFQATFKNKKYSGEDQIMVVEFLLSFAEEANTLKASKAHALLKLPKLLNRQAERQLRSVRNGARSGGVTWWPEAVEHFLRTYETPATIS